MYKILDLCIFSLFNHIKPASQLSLSCDYNYFKNGIKPMWEDGRNTEGGRWLIQLPNAKNCPQLDDYWKNIVIIYFNYFISLNFKLYNDF